MIKPEGLNFAVVYSDGPEMEWFLSAHEAKSMNGKGYGFLMAGDGFTFINNEVGTEGLLNTGGLFVIENSLETAASVSEMHMLRIVNIMERVA